MVWQPGQSGNPLGQNLHRKPWRLALERALKREHRLRFDGKRHHPTIISTVDEHGISIVPEAQMLEVIADMTVQRAACGDHDAMIEIGNRLDGRPPQTLEGSDVPIIHSVRWLEDEPKGLPTPERELTGNAEDAHVKIFSDDMEFSTPTPQRIINEIVDAWEDEVEPNEEDAK